MSLMVSTGAEPKALSELLKWEVHPQYVRETGTYQAGSGAAVEIALGTVLGLAAMLTITAGAVVGTGNGTVSGTALKANAQAGVYDVEFTGATTFAVYDPLGNRLADGATGAAYDNGQIAFTITAGGTAFEAGTSISFTVAKSDGELTPLDLDTFDGSHRVAAVAGKAITVPDGSTATGLVLKRGPARIVRNHLVYPSGATDAQKAAIEAELTALGFLVETAV